jgi:hypothetical protein
MHDGMKVSIFLKLNHNLADPKLRSPLSPYASLLE